MMTDKTKELRDLLAKVEAGEWWDDLPRPAKLHTDLCWKAFNGSLDAAKALHEAVLPGWPFNVHFEQHTDGHYCALFGAITDDATKWTFAPKWEAKTPLQSRSLLACELRALIAQAEQ